MPKSLSDDAWSSCSDLDTQGNNTSRDNEFEINDQYINDDFVHNINTDIPVPEPYPGPVELNDTLEFDHYFLDPEGLNLIDPFAIPQGHLNEEDPEPYPGPFDPG